MKPNSNALTFDTDLLSLKEKKKLTPSKLNIDTAIEIISALLILLFVYAAASKLIEYKSFSLQLSKSPFITQFAGIIAWALPSGEIIVGLALLFKSTRLVGLYASLFLMSMFTFYIYTMLNYSYFVPCSCGGILSKMTWQQHLWFNIIFTALSIAGILLHITRRTSLKKP